MKVTAAKVIATVGGIGYIKKGAGTVAATVYCLLWWQMPEISIWIILLGLVVVTMVGVWSSAVVEKIWEHDSNKIVVDELAGMMLTLIYSSTNGITAIVGCILFRFFDIVKPLGIRKMEKLPHGWGVMADDLLAGLYSLAVLQALHTTKLLP